MVNEHFQRLPPSKGQGTTRYSSSPDSGQESSDPRAEKASCLPLVAPDSPTEAQDSDSDPSGSYRSHCPFTHTSAFSKECLLLELPVFVFLQHSLSRILSPMPPHRLRDTVTHQWHSVSLCALVQPSNSFLCLPFTQLWYQLDSPSFL